MKRWTIWRKKHGCWAEFCLLSPIVRSLCPSERTRLSSIEWDRKGENKTKFTGTLSNKPPGLEVLARAFTAKLSHLKCCNSVRIRGLALNSHDCWRGGKKKRRLDRSVLPVGVERLFAPLRWGKRDREMDENGKAMKLPLRMHEGRFTAGQIASPRLQICKACISCFLADKRM